MLNIIIQKLYRIFYKKHILDLANTLSKINPNKIYVNDISNLLGVPIKRAQEICDKGVEQGIFSKELILYNGQSSTNDTEKQPTHTYKFISESY